MPLSPLLATVFLVGWIGAVCSLLLLLGLLGHATDWLLAWHERRELKRPFAAGVRFPRPFDLDQNGGGP